MHRGTTFIKLKLRCKSVQWGPKDASAAVQVLYPTLDCVSRQRLKLCIHGVCYNLLGSHAHTLWATFSRDIRSTNRSSAGFAQDSLLRYSLVLHALQDAHVWEKSQINNWMVRGCMCKEPSMIDLSSPARLKLHDRYLKYKPLRWGHWQVDCKIRPHVLGTAHISHLRHNYSAAPAQQSVTWMPIHHAASNANLSDSQLSKHHSTACAPCLRHKYFAAPPSSEECHMISARLPCCKHNKLLALSGLWM